MRLFGDLCSYWTLKKSAILFGCVELCVSEKAVFKLLRRARRSSESLFVWVVLFVLCLGAFVAYMYAILKNKYRFLVLPSFIQSFVFLPWIGYESYHYISYFIDSAPLFYKFYALFTVGIYAGLYLSNIIIKYSMFKRMNSNSQPEQQQSHQTSESSPII